MADKLPTDEPGAPAALPEPPGAPWVTMLTAVLIFFVFGGLVLLVLHYADGLGAKQSTAQTGEQQLQELRAAEREVLNNYGYDAQTKTFRIPIDRAMDVLIEEAKDKDQMQSFPAKPKPKSKGDKK